MDQHPSTRDGVKKKTKGKPGSGLPSTRTSPPSANVRPVRGAASSATVGSSGPPQSRKEPVQNWSGRLDLNQRPLGPEPSALPGCATPRRSCSQRTPDIEAISGQDRPLGIHSPYSVGHPWSPISLTKTQPPRSVHRIPSFSFTPLRSSWL